MILGEAGLRPSRAQPLKLFMIAGEHSGDDLGADLMRALRDRAGAVRFEGIGGDAMTREGLDAVFPMADIAVMGFVPVLLRLRRILRRIDDAVAAVLAAKPDALVIIDSPDFTHRVARRVRRHDPSIPIIDYVSPTVWAWRPGRAPAMRAYVDHLLALLPFEPEAHRRLGGPPCTYVGHPLIERLDVLRPDAQERDARQRPSLLILPGSRRSEITRLSPIFGEVLRRIADRIGEVDALLPAVQDHEALIRQQVAAWAVTPRIVTGEAAKFAAFRQARAALAASGTVTLELALSGVPMVVGYKVSPLEVWLKYVIRVPSIVLPNLVIGHNIVPEFLQSDCTPDKLAHALLPLLVGGRERDAQLAGFASLDAIMRLGGGTRPSARAADVILTNVEASPNWGGVRPHIAEDR